MTKMTINTTATINTENAKLFANIIGKAAKYSLTTTALTHFARNEVLKDFKKSSKLKKALKIAEAVGIAAILTVEENRVENELSNMLVKLVNSEPVNKSGKIINIIRKEA